MDPRFRGFSFVLIRPVAGRRDKQWSFLPIHLVDSFGDVQAVHPEVGRCPEGKCLDDVRMLFLTLHCHWRW